MNLIVWILDRRNLDKVAIQSSVSMSVYMDTASYVKIPEFAGRIRLFSHLLRSKESLKYVAWALTRGWSILSTHSPSAWGKLAQSNQTGLVLMGVLCSL